MDQNLIAIAEMCRDGAAGNTMTFPEIVGTLMKNGFEGYAVDFRSRRTTYYTTDGQVADLQIHEIKADIAPAFDAARVREAISEAQRLAPGYTYVGFCEKVRAPDAPGISCRSAAAVRSISAAPLKHTSKNFRTDLYCGGAADGACQAGPDNSVSIFTVTSSKTPILVPGRGECR